MNIDEIRKLKTEHTPAASGIGRQPTRADHCPACSETANNWVNATEDTPCVVYQLAVEAERLAADSERWQVLNAESIDERDYWRRKAERLAGQVARVELLAVVWDGDTSTTYTADEFAQHLRSQLTLTHRNGEPLADQPERVQP